MRIVVIAPGSRGDIQPYVALGKGLRGSGHEVQVVTNAEFESLVRSYGLDCRPVAIGVEQAFQEEEARSAIEGGGVLASFAKLAELARRSARLLAEVGMEACRGTDLILCGFSGLLIGHSLSEALRIPLVHAYNVPLTPTGKFPGALVPAAPFLPVGIANRLSHRATRQVVWQTARMAGAKARREVLGLGPAPFFGPFRSDRLAGSPVLCGWSSHVIPKPSDWHPGIHVTGYWYLDEPSDWTPPPGLEAFLSNGPRPIYVGFGSMSHRDPAATTRLVFDAIRMSGQRAVVHTGWGGLGGGDLPKDVFLAGSVPHAWLFPRMAAVVHHAGAGTTAAGFRAGVPSLLVPFHGDQPFWGGLTAGLGVGPAPITRKRLTAERLAASITSALSDAPMRKKAAALGGKIRQEDGVAQAVRLIETHYEHRKG
jgi:sterol 3beta-glucosyltransferase